MTDCDYEDMNYKWATMRHRWNISSPSSELEYEDETLQVKLLQYSLVYY